MTAPGIPNNFVLSTACFGTRLRTLEDQAFAAVAMGFRQIEIGLSEEPVPINGFEDTRRETGVKATSVMAGCLKPRRDDMASMHLGSLKEDTREQALNSVRRHIRLAQTLGAPVLVLRGTATEDVVLRREADDLESRLLREGLNDELRADVRAFVKRLVATSAPELEQMCRSLFTLVQEFPETQLALEPGVYIDDLLSFEAMGWVLDDLSKHPVGYWHDVGRIHLQERAGLPCQGQWLESYASRMLGVHLQDAADQEAEMPPGLGEVDFRLIAGYLPKSTARVVDINPRHGRAEILESIQFLVNQGV